MLLLLVLARHDIPLLATVLGGCYGLAWENKDRKEGRLPLLVAAVISALVLLLNVWLYFLRDFDFERFPRSYEQAGLLTALAILHLVFTFRPLQGPLAAEPLVALGGLSFAIYVIHYPLIGLLSCPMIYALWDRLPYIPLILLAFAVTSAACLLLAFAYNRIIERPCYAGIRKLIGFLGEN